MAKHVKLSVEQEKALYFYDLYSETYRSLVPEYQRLLEEKRSLGIRLYTLNHEVLNGFPESELLGIEKRSDAIGWIKNQNRTSLNNEMQRIDIIIKENYSYRSLVSWVEDAKAQIKAKKYKSTRAGFYCTSGTGTKTTCKRTSMG